MNKFILSRAVRYNFVYVFLTFLFSDLINQIWNKTTMPWMLWTRLALRAITTTNYKALSTMIINPSPKELVSTKSTTNTALTRDRSTRMIFRAQLESCVWSPFSDKCPTELNSSEGKFVTKNQGQGSCPLGQRFRLLESRKLVSTHFWPLLVTYFEAARAVEKFGLILKSKYQIKLGLLKSLIHSVLAIFWLKTTFCICLWFEIEELNLYTNNLLEDDGRSNLFKLFFSN